MPISEMRTTHVFGDFGGGASKTFDIPTAPDGQLAVIDYIAWSATQTTVGAAISIVIRRGDGSQNLWRKVSTRVATANDEVTVEATFPAGFPCWGHTTGGSSLTSSEITRAPVSGTEVAGLTVGGTAGSVTFTVAYHYEPISWRSASGGA